MKTDGEVKLTASTPAWFPAWLLVAPSMSVVLNVKDELKSGRNLVRNVFMSALFAFCSSKAETASVALDPVMAVVGML